MARAKATAPEYGVAGSCSVPTTRIVGVGRETGAEVLVMPPSVGGVKEVTDYFKLFDYDLNLLMNAIKKVGTK